MTWQIRRASLRSEKALHFYFQTVQFTDHIISNGRFEDRHEPTLPVTVSERSKEKEVP